MSIGRILALDPGSKRVGVAVSDPLQIVASPLTVLEADGAVAAVEKLVEEYQPVLILVGLPVSLGGGEGPAGAAARAFAEKIRHATGVPVEMVDERFTTQTAERAMIEGRVRRRERRRKVDKVAAAVILRHYLERHA